MKTNIEILHENLNKITNFINTENFNIGRNIDDISIWYNCLLDAQRRIERALNKLERYSQETKNNIYMILTLYEKESKTPVTILDKDDIALELEEIFFNLIHKIEYKFFTLDVSL